MIGIGKIFGINKIEHKKPEEQKPILLSKLDSYEQGYTLKDLAKGFTKDVMVPVSNPNSELYIDYRLGGNELKDKINHYTGLVDSLNKEDAINFEKLVLGSNQRHIIEAESEFIPELKLFYKTLITRTIIDKEN